MIKITALTTAVVLAATPAALADDAYTLALPIKCEPGVTCFVQNYVDHDSSEKVRDFACGRRSYNGHDGTDIRIPDLEIQKKGVEVLAAAPGRVLRVRDGIDDVSVRETGRAAVAGKECGNGAVIAHRDGWSTQYCHMAKGSLRVKAGDDVTAGQPLGLVGLSGDTEFPHIHLTVRHNGTMVDPFAADAASEACNGGHALWAPAQAAALAYRGSEILNAGFAGLPVTMELIESGAVKAPSRRQPKHWWPMCAPSACRPKTCRS
ncbi:M23 family metallopeptidase [Bradyrhizobium prioriisuperbiae]|uniref:M23 family metallopeptidase n=1 Tax=Bradyrhizobium prioriisuperbiae TaxID=2854389 RepID=UPI0028E901AB|nr:M23 family metallopeptidase [Bradyrhizobium prioritasuperba]